MARASLPPLPALVVGHTHHTRHEPMERSFTHATHEWLVDLDQGLELPWWARRFITLQAADHLGGDPSLSALRSNVLRIMQREGIDTTSVARVVMLTNARILGHVFDPMTMYWCLDAEGAEVGSVVEVHNTYGERHAYALGPSTRGARNHLVDKEFYVSPFNDTDGHYIVRHRLSERSASVSVVLHRDERPLLTATVTGACVPLSSATLARTLLRQPLMSQRVSALIRMHGIWLWLRRLPIHPRPQHGSETVR